MEWVFAAIFAIIVGFEQGYYWSETVRVWDAYVWKCGWWKTSPPGSLFPWPKESGLLERISEMESPMDMLVCYLLEYRLFIHVAVAIVLFFAALGWFLGKKLNSLVWPNESE